MSTIIGIGIDMEEVQRIEHMIEKWGEQFLNRIFSEEEILYCQSKNFPSQHFAARFAAKEAFAKAIGTGWSGKFRWHDIEVRNHESGKPYLVAHNFMKTASSGKEMLLSLSHTTTQVTALVIIQEPNAEKYSPQFQEVQ